MVDCGVFLLIYADLIIHNSDQFLLKKKLCRSEISAHFYDLFKVNADKPREMRAKILQIIDQLAAKSTAGVESDDSDVECLKVVKISKRHYKQKGTVDSDNDPEYLPPRHMKGLYRKQ